VEIVVSIVVVPGMMEMPTSRLFGIACGISRMFRWKIPGMGRRGRRNVGDCAVRKE
jgi:hypothetical protein